MQSERGSVLHGTRPAKMWNGYGMESLPVLSSNTREQNACGRSSGLSFPKTPSHFSQAGKAVAVSFWVEERDPGGLLLTEKGIQQRDCTGFSPVSLFTSSSRGWPKVSPNGSGRCGRCPTVKNATHRIAAAKVMKTIRKAKVWFANSVCPLS